MGAPAALGAAVTAAVRRAWRAGAAALLLSAAVPEAALGGERYALIVTGASGEPQYAEKYRGWREPFVAALRDRFGYPQDRILVLAEDEAPGVRRATAANVRTALADLRRRTTKDDVVLVLLIGHGTTLDGDEGKFNLVGPDLTGREWAGLLQSIAARLVFVNTSGGSFPFLRQLAAPGRIVVTATESTAQEFDTLFPEHFLRAFVDEAADADKDRKVSIWEAFAFASARVREAFEMRGQLATETALLDDTGLGLGRPAASDGPDGALARATYLQPDVVIPAGADAELAGLLKRRAELQASIDRLRAGKPAVPSEQYETELEKLLLELTRVDREIRARS